MMESPASFRCPECNALLRMLVDRHDVTVYCANGLKCASLAANAGATANTEAEAFDRLWRAIDHEMEAR